MAVTTLDGLVAALTQGEIRYFVKGSFTPFAVGTAQSLWTVAGTPAAGAAQGTVNGAICDDTTTGGFPFTNAVGAANNYLGYFAASPLVAGSLIVYDRLWHDSALSATATTNQVIAPPALTRYTNGEGVEIWAEQYAAMGAATAATITLQYTDQSGTTAQTATIAKAATAGANGVMYGPASLAAGDFGVRAVTGYSWSVTQTSGNWGLTLVKRLLTIPFPQVNVGAAVDAFSSGLREIADDACLAFIWVPTATTANTITGEFTIAKG